MKGEISDNKFDINFVFCTRFVYVLRNEVATYPYAQPSIAYMVAARAAIIIILSTYNKTVVNYMSKNRFRT